MSYIRGSGSPTQATVAYGLGDVPYDPSKVACDPNTQYWDTTTGRCVAFPATVGPAQQTPCEQLYDPTTEAVALAHCLQKRGAAGKSTFPVVPVVLLVGGGIVLWAALKGKR